jgi:hypothetical protein
MKKLIAIAVIGLISVSVFGQDAQNCEVARKKYLEANPDVKEAGVDPWNHYLGAGKFEGRKWYPCAEEIKTTQENTEISPVIGNPIKLGNLLIAEHDFKMKMNWDVAKKACSALGDGWHLPNKDELNELYKHKYEIGSFTDDHYWSSSEFNESNNQAWEQYFFNGNPTPPEKNSSLLVRAVKVKVQSSRENSSLTILKIDENKKKLDSKKISESTKPSNQDNPSLPILKVSEKNASNQLPKTILVFDKTQSLIIGNTVTITKVEKIKVPGEKKPQIVPSIMGSGRVIERVNNIYTVKLNANTAQKLKDYKDGDESYFCMKAEDKIVLASKPRIMVIPKLIKQDLFKDGDYQLNSFEKMIIASFKNKLEDNDYTTIGFESILKKVYEDRLINEGTKVDLKVLILEASGSDFYVEFEPLESNDCNKTLDFKIRNYANGEDVASDIKIMNTCGTPDDYKNFASAILNDGSLNKINTQYASLVSQGRKVSANFTIKNGSTAEFGKEYNGIRLEEYIENCIQQYAFNGNYKLAGTVNNRMSFSEVSIPLLKEETGQNYSPNAFSLDILKFLKEQAGIECEKSVVGSNINITIK